LPGWGPIFAALVWQGMGGLLFTQGVFFSKAALVTFGGAYAVLPYVTQKAVEQYHWLGASQMLDGLGLAETTPGPLIIVLEFVGFMGGWNHGSVPSLTLATLGAAITLWATFVPSFIFILLGAPYVEKMRGSRKLAGALSAITAVVVGVILNLALWFGGHVLFPDGSALDVFALLLAAVAFVGLVRWNWGLIPVTLGGALAGFVFSYWRLMG
jgi:chromate transporter